MTRKPPQLVLLVAALTATVATAEPMDLGNPDARWVSVRFEVSPADRPGQIDTVYSDRIVARLEPGKHAGRVELTISGRAVEDQLLREHDPVPGSFSDFVWSFDAATGHVLSATVSGTLIRSLDLGLWTSQLEARVRFEMDTRRIAGFRGARRLLGQRVHHFCLPNPAEECHPVNASAYDSATGYVNAVGHVDVETRLMQLRTFSSLGEAIFSELDPSPDHRWAALAPEH